MKHIINIMAAEEENLDLEEETPTEAKSKKAAKHDSGAADLEKVTDFVEEAEISSQNIGDVSMRLCTVSRGDEIPSYRSIHAVH